LGYGIIVVGMVLMYFSSSDIGSIVMLAGCVLFGFVLVFQLVTLPVEFVATAATYVMAAALRTLSIPTRSSG
jgi:Zn-dependent membrane protease YugP